MKYVKSFTFAFVRTRDGNVNQGRWVDYMRIISGPQYFFKVFL